jgi:nucleotide-binding universal stress UspA family protein
MTQLSRPTCDRHGHVIVPNRMAAEKRNDPHDCPSRKSSQPTRIPKIAREKQRSSGKVATGSPIKQILVPIDAVYTNIAKVKPVLRFAQRFGATVTLLHCYATPRSFSFLRGPSALAEVIYHRNMVRGRLVQIHADLRTSFPECKCRFTSGSLPEEILKASENIGVDLIVVPAPLDLISDCWTTASLMDELARQAECPVLELPDQQELLKHSNMQRRRNNEWSELNDGLILNGTELP